MDIKLSTKNIEALGFVGNKKSYLFEMVFKVRRGKILLLEIMKHDSGHYIILSMIHGEKTIRMNIGTYKYLLELKLLIRALKNNR